MYKLKLDQKLRRSNSSVYITIKVKDEQTEVLSALDELKEELSNQTEAPEVSDTPSVGDGNLEDTVTLEDKPEIENDNVVDSTDKNDTVTNHEEDKTVVENEQITGSYNNIVNSSDKDSVAQDVADEENPKTGDVSVFSYVGGGFVSLVGIFGLNRRKRK